MGLKLRASLLLLLAPLAAGASSDTVDWDSESWTTEATTYTATLTDGDVVFTVTDADSALQTGYPIQDQTNTGGLSPAQDSILFGLDFTAATVTNGVVSITIDFDDYYTNAGAVDVYDVVFDVFDIDTGASSFVDEFTVYATDGSATDHYPSMTFGSANQEGTPTSSGVAEGTASSGGTSANGNVTFDFTGVNDIRTITIEYRNLDTTNHGFQWASLHDIDFEYDLEQDLSASSKTVDTPTGVSVASGASIQYQIDVDNSSPDLAAASVRVYDDIPANTSWDHTTDIVTFPVGAYTDNSSSTGGLYGNGYLDITITSLGTSSTETIEFTVDVDGGASAGTIITNNASITTDDADNVTVFAPTRIVDAGSITPGTANAKPLYFDTPGTVDLSRIATTQAGGVTLDEGETLDMPITVTRDFTVTGADIPIDFWIRRNGQNGNNRQLSWDLYCCTGTIGSDTSLANFSSGGTFALPAHTTWYWTPDAGDPPDNVTLSWTAASPYTFNDGDVITLRLTNDSSGSGNRRIRTRSESGGNVSQIELDIIDPILVDSVTTYDAAYPGGMLQTEFELGDTVYVRVVVSDPFGSSDINVDDDSGTLPRINIDDPDSSVVTNQDTTEVADSGDATKTFEYQYTIPNPGPPTDAGIYSIDIDEAFEGEEGTIAATGTGGFTVVAPDITVSKSSVIVDDTVGGTAYHVPGSVVRYTVTVTNDGDDEPDLDSVLIIDGIPSGMELYVGDGADCTAAAPISFSAGSSGLSYDCTTDLRFTDDATPPYDFTGSAYDPYPSSSPFFDGNVTAIELSPEGIFADGGASFSFSFDVRVP